MPTATQQATALTAPATGAARSSSVVGPVMAVGLPALALATLTANPVASGWAIAVLMAIVLLLWRPGEPPILLFISGMQWLQGAAKTLHADILDEPLWTLSYAQGLEESSMLTLAWVLAFAVGMRLSLMRARDLSMGQEHRIEGLSPGLAFRLYLAWTLGMLVLERVAPGGLRQVVVAIAALRWALVFAIFWMVLRSRRQWHLLLLVFGAEFVAGFLSFFSAFKIPVYLLAVASLTTGMRMRRRQLAGFAVIAVFAVYLGVVWSAIKEDYRSTLNRGSGEQVVQIGVEQRVRRLGGLVEGVDGDVLADGVERLIDRFAYVEFFAHVVDHVPALEPHANGEIHAGALRHVFMPRLLFPDKGDLESDTFVAERYTGLILSHGHNSTSISIGTPADSYVDFGAIGMHVSALLLGLLAGAGYRVTAGLRGRKAIAVSLAVALMLPLASIEHSVVKLVGGQVTRLLAVWVIWQFAIPIGLQLLEARRRGADARTRATG